MHRMLPENESVDLTELAMVFIATLVFVSTSFAGEVPLENLAAASFKPGQLKLPLIVTERSGIARQDAVVTGGVPFPPGFLLDVSKLAVVD